MENPSSFLLNEDLILSILSKLPFETQQRFCSVSKSWLDMIANPDRPESCYSYWLKFYRKLPATPTLFGFFYPRVEDDTPYNIDWHPVSISEQHQQLANLLPTFPESTLSLFDKHDDSMRLKASSNGVLLCERIEHCESESFEGDAKLPLVHYFYVINPLTQQQVELPAVLKHLGCGSVAFEYSVTPLRFTVVLVDLGTQPNHPTLDVRVFSSDQNYWTEFHKSVNDNFSVSSLGSFPGVFVRGKLLFWFCNNNNFLLGLNLTKLDLWCIELPHHFSSCNGYRALCAFEGCLFVGVQEENSINVIVYNAYLRHVMGDSCQFEYDVCLQELKEKCRNKIKVDDVIESRSVIYYKGFHPRNPEIIFFLFQGRLVSYDIKRDKLVVHTAEDTHLPVSAYASEELDSHWFPCEWWMRPLSLPSVHQEYLF